MVGRASIEKTRRESLASNAASECSDIEFSKEDIEALLKEKPKGKDRFNLKEKCENMVAHIRRLKLCVRWFQEVESTYSIDQEKLWNEMEYAQLRSTEMELLLMIKEEELNLMVTELRTNYASLQEEFIKEESDKLAIMHSLSKEKEARLNIERSEGSLSGDLGRTKQELLNANDKISSLDDMYKQLQDYIASLQQYNGKLHSELATVEEELKCIEKENAVMAENISMLRGQLKVYDASREEATKHKDSLINEVLWLRSEVQQVREDRNRQLSQVESLIAEVAKYKEISETSCSQLDNLKKRKHELEALCPLQTSQIGTLQIQLEASENKLQVSDLSSLESKTEFEEQRKLVNELQSRVAIAEEKVMEGEKLRKKLLNTILELKGNIRLLCRVRPPLPDEDSCSKGTVILCPTSVECIGREIDLMQNGQRHSFTFDKVFTPNATQEHIFMEISQLLQSALDGHKVCIFAYGQTGSGKTYTMTGRQENPEEKGIISRSLEQIFLTRKSLQSQGWKYEMQVSMLEIYNETIYDLLSTNRSSSNGSRIENGSPGKQFAIRHDANGYTHVSGLTVVDVRSSKDVSFLLDQAERSRSVGKTQMNERSSRSHFVFALRIFGVNESTGQQVHGVLNLIDLAGSERLSRSGSTGDRLKETQATNKSLSSLSDVFFALAKKEQHVPFRNSKLTYLLQPCLGRDSKILIFVNISPEQSSAGESLCSLRFAARVSGREIGITSIKPTCS